MSKHARPGRRRTGALLMILGGLLMAAALALGGYSAWDEFRANAAAQAVAVQLTRLTVQAPEQEPPAQSDLPQVLPGPQPDPEVQEPLPALPEPVPDYVQYPEMEMPLAQINGRDCLGLLELPALERTLPVLAVSDDASLKYAPGCYAGSVYARNMVIAGHNYTSHFGKLRTLKAGDRVFFTDLDGNRFAYEVADLESLEPTDIQGMTTGDWDLTLFTCTYGNRQRLAVRCFLLEE